MAEFQFGQGQVAGIVLAALDDLAVAVADQADIGVGFIDFGQGCVNQVLVGDCGVVCHVEREHVLPERGLADGGAVVF